MGLVGAVLLALRVGALLSLRADRDRHPLGSAPRWNASWTWSERLKRRDAPIAAFWLANEWRKNGTLYGRWELRRLGPPVVYGPRVGTVAATSVAA